MVIVVLVAALLGLTSLGALLAAYRFPALWPLALGVVLSAGFLLHPLVGDAVRLPWRFGPLGDFLDAAVAEVIFVWLPVLVLHCWLVRFLFVRVYEEYTRVALAAVLRRNWLVKAHGARTGWRVVPPSAPAPNECLSPAYNKREVTDSCQL